MTGSNTQNGRVLIVDNDLDSLDATKEYLESEGYSVFTASTSTEAETIITQERIHLAIIDKRLKDDTDLLDKSGLVFAFLVDPIVAKIIQTGYPDQKTTRDAFINGIVDYVDKEEEPERLLEAVERAFIEKIQIDFGLEIYWNNGVTLGYIAQMIALEDQPLEVAVSEIEEILRKLFYEVEKDKKVKEIIVTSLLSTEESRLSAQSGTVILKVQPTYEMAGRGAPVVVKLTSRKKIDIEYSNYSRFVKAFIPDNQRTNLEKYVTLHFLGGLVYSLIGLGGSSLGDIKDLGEFYADHDAEKVITALDSLFRQTCKLWYDNRDPSRSLDIVELYNNTFRISGENFKEALREQRLTEFIEPYILRFSGLHDNFINPIQWFDRIGTWRKSIHICLTHGDLHSGNIMLGNNERAWLIDFYRTGKGHILRDWIELETDIKFNLLSIISLPQLFKLEVALLTPRQLGDEPPLVDFSHHLEIEKAFKIITGLRDIAKVVLGSEVEMDEYYQGLFLMTLNVLQLRNIDWLKKQHALLSASLLAQRLQNWPNDWLPDQIVSKALPGDKLSPLQKPDTKEPVSIKFNGKTVFYTLVLVFGLVVGLIILLWGIFSLVALSIQQTVFAIIFFFILVVFSLIILNKLQAEIGVKEIGKVLMVMGEVVKDLSLTQRKNKPPN